MDANNERPFSGAAKGEPVEQKPSFDKRFALLIDADNVSSKYIKPILDELSKYGTITYKRIYGDWTSTLHAKWKDALLDNSITPIQQFSYTVGKNATDSAMILDAMDILYTNSVEGFCLVSSDSDFTRLASRIRESGLTVIGMGEKKTPTPFRKACDIFTTLELLIGEARRDKANGSSSSLTIEEVERAVVDIITDNQNNGKSTGLGEVGSRLLKRYPDFDVRSFGTNLLSKLLGEFKSVTIRKDGSNVRVELAEGADHEHAAGEKHAAPEGALEQVSADAEPETPSEDSEGEGGEESSAHGSKPRRRRSRRRKSSKVAGADQGESSDSKADEEADSQQAEAPEPASSQEVSAERKGEKPTASAEQQTADSGVTDAAQAPEGEAQPAEVVESQSAEGDGADGRQVPAARKGRGSGRSRKAKSATEQYKRDSRAVAKDNSGESGAVDAEVLKADRVEASAKSPAAAGTAEVDRAQVASGSSSDGKAQAAGEPVEVGTAQAPSKRRRSRTRKTPAAPNAPVKSSAPAESDTSAAPSASNAPAASSARMTPDDFIRSEVGKAGADGVAVAELAKRVRTRFKSFKVRELGYPHLAGYLADVEGVRVYKQGRENWVAKE